MRYDSTSDTVKHILRVAELMGEVIRDLVERSTQHDRSKLEEPELSAYNEHIPKLKQHTYGTPEYHAAAAALGEGLAHHHAANRHHKEHFREGVNNMTLVDLIEMLADWKAASERDSSGSFSAGWDVRQERNGLDDQLTRILRNTAASFGWMEPHRDFPVCGSLGKAPNGDVLDCNQVAGHDRANRVPGARLHCDGSRDNMVWSDGKDAWV